VITRYWRQQNHSFSCLLFFWGESRGQQPCEDSKCLTIKSNFRSFCWLHIKTGPNMVSDVVIPPGRWTNFGPLSCGCRLQLEGLSSPFFPGTFWTHGRTNTAGISRFGEVGWHPGICGFQTCALCHEVSHRELFANIPSLPFVLLTVFFQSSPKNHDHRWGSEERPT